jgi:hypothetical protein
VLAAADCRGEICLHDVFDGCSYLTVWADVGSAEGYAIVGSCRQYLQLDAFAGVKADTDTINGFFDGALPQHVFLPDSLPVWESFASRRIVCLP